MAVHADWRFDTKPHPAEPFHETVGRYADAGVEKDLLDGEQPTWRLRAVDSVDMHFGSRAVLLGVENGSRTDGLVAQSKPNAEHRLTTPGAA